MDIRNDQDFKTALSKLGAVQQRLVAARFAENVLDLCEDMRVTAAINAARRPDVSEAELAVVFQAAKAACVETYTRCGQEADWRNQASHFVAKAALACVSPPDRTAELAWGVAMNARMARTCETIANGQGTEHREAEQQYRILAEFMKQ
ncbi:MAG: hypothetical protein NZ524_04730 [Thiobacillaceae bacterium]|nr:hypothetical protein [Thiobacillaceae bacterium]MCX7672140.1 hypothetical protein [Thiobacillaceae bacterium]MDW8324395.1 hypothetical protein [Burkholderiales bacterium]